MVDFMRSKKWWFGISGILLIPGILGLSTWHLTFGIDFKGGSLAEYQVIDQQKDQKIIIDAFAKEGIKEPVIQTADQNNKPLIIIRTESITDATHQSIVRLITTGDSKIQEISFENVSPQIGQDTANKAILAVIVASLAIIGYIAWAFRGVPKPASSWRFGVIAVIALLHDVLFIIGAYSLLGHYFHYEVDANFITAVLTVMGFSVHDTIVVFDRVRENLKRYNHMTFTQTVNASLNQTIARSINTSLTVLMTLLAVALLGGVSIRPFAVTLLLGIATGTYSSIFVATPLLDLWQSWNSRKTNKNNTKRSKKFGFGKLLR